MIQKNGSLRITEKDTKRLLKKIFKTQKILNLNFDWFESNYIEFDVKYMNIDEIYMLWACFGDMIVTINPTDDGKLLRIMIKEKISV